MKTVILVQPGRLELSETKPPESPGPNEALVRVRRIGICGTDMHAFQGNQPYFTYPRILGHELGVEVEAVGRDVVRVKPGDRCAVEPYLHCGSCVACRAGKSNCCANLRVFGVHTDGGMRERVILPAEKLHPSSKLDFDQLAIVEMLSIGAHAIRRAEPREGENTLVIGAGPIGLGVLAFARLSGARPAGMEVRSDRVAFARSALGINDWIKPGEGALDEIRDVSGGELPTLVFDATGNPQSMMTAFRYVAHGGRLVYVGLFQGDVTFNDPHFHGLEMSLIGSRNATSEDFRRVMDALDSGALDVSGWITHRAPFDEAVGVFPHWLDPSAAVVKAELMLD